MQFEASASWRAGVVALLIGLTGGVALAEKPEWAGRGGKGGGGEQARDERGRNGYGGAYSDAGVEMRLGGYFNDGHRQLMNDYYGQQFRSGGDCPPGLAKKNNGCMPPGQARKWAVGQALPQDVPYYPIDPALRGRLGTPPAGYDYVRVASDVLMIAVGSRMVVDAVKDIGRR